jgi:RND family efflux transporter MFP subunit
MTAQIQLVNINYKSIGTLAPRKAPIIRAQIGGQIDELLVNEGEEVHKGQILIKMKQEELSLVLQESEAKVMQAKAMLHEAKKSIERSNKLIGKGYISKEQYDQFQAQHETAKANLIVAEANLNHAHYQSSQANVVSPINGHIGKIVVSVGEFVSANANLMNIVNHDELLAELPFSEQKTDLLIPGQKVILTSPSDPNQKLTSTITSVTPDINPDNRAIQVLIVFANKYHWKPGSSIAGEIFATPIKAIMVPEESIVMNENDKVVYVVKNNKAFSQPIETGNQIDGWVQITKGLKANDQVVINGAYYLSNGMSVLVKKAGG